MPDTETPTPDRPVSVITCINRRHPSRSCYALIENTKDVRIAHRQWHLDQETDREALRGAVKSRDETIARLREEISGYRRDVTAFDQTVQGLHGEVQRVETPTIPPQLEIERGGYADDELDDEPDEPDPVAADQDLTRDLDPDALADALADADTDGWPAVAPPASADQGDDDDEDDPRVYATPTAPSWAR